MDLDRRSPNFYAAKMSEGKAVWLIAAMSATQAEQELKQSGINYTIGALTLSKIGSDTYGIEPSVIGSFPYAQFIEHFE